MTEAREPIEAGASLRLSGGVDVSAQVATGINPETGEVVVLVRLGQMIGALTPEGAAQLADALAIEAAYATTTRAQARYEFGVES